MALLKEANELGLTKMIKDLRKTVPVPAQNGDGGVASSTSSTVDAVKKQACVIVQYWRKEPDAMTSEPQLQPPRGNQTGGALPARRREQFTLR